MGSGVLEDTGRGKPQCRGPVHECQCLRCAQLKREARPALLDQLMSPSVFQGPADLLPVVQLVDDQHAGRQRDQEAVEIGPAGVGRQERFQACQAGAPARRC